MFITASSALFGARRFFRESWCCFPFYYLKLYDIKSEYMRHLSVESPIDLMGEFSWSLTADLLIVIFPALIGPDPKILTGDALLIELLIGDALLIELFSSV